MIRIYDRRLDLCGEIDNFKSLIFTHKFHGVGNFELHVHFDTKYAENLIRGNYISVDDRGDCVGFIRSRSIKKKDNIWVIRGYTLKGILSKRITYPLSGRDTQRVSGNYETVMKEIVRFNCINPENPKRKMPRLTIAQDLQRGNFGTWETRYKKLEEELEEISLASMIGWEVYFDSENKQLIFDVRDRVDRSANQSDRPPVVFAIDYENIEDLDYLEDSSNYKNVAIVAGQGQGADRMVVELGSMSEIDREELFIDARDIEASTDLPSRGLQKLSEFKYVETFDGTITAGKYVFGKDYFLGDTVTLRDAQWAITLDTLVTEVKEVWEGGQYKSEPVFGNNIPTVWSEIKRDMKMIRNGIRR